jgi:hypothetical protein
MRKDIELHKRDFAADMRKYIDAGRSGNGSYNAATLAQEIAERLLTEDRELLYGWLEAHAVATIRAAITATDAATRSYARQNHQASVFAAAVREAEKGDDQPLRLGFLQAVYTINADNDRKALKDMVAADLRFVAGSYEQRAESSLLEAAFLRAVAKKIGKGRVADTFNNVQLDELRTRITGK